MTGKFYRDEDVYNWTDLLNFDYPLSSIKKRNYEVNGAIVLGAGSYGTVIKSPYNSPFHLHREDKHRIVVALKIISKEPPENDLKKEAEGKIHRAIQEKMLRGGNKVKQSEVKKEDVKNQTIELHRLRVRNEIAILGNINSVKAHSTIFYESFESKKCFYISTELLNGGPIWERLVTLSPFTEEHIIKTMRPIINGLHYLHETKIVHRDIRLSNLVFRSPDPDNFDVVIIDFGFAQCYKNTPKDIGLPTAGKYMAPEVITEVLQGRSVKPKPREDMWAVGVITYKLLTGIYPFLTKKQNEKYKEIDAKYCKNVMEMDYRIDSVKDRHDRASNRAENNNKTENHLEGVSEEAKVFVQGLLHKSISERWTAERAEGDTWLGPEFTPPSRDLPGLREDSKRHRGSVERERPSRGHEAADVDVSLRQTQSRAGTGENASTERPKQKRSRLSFRDLLHGRKKKNEEQEVHEVLTRSGSHKDHGQSAVSRLRKKNDNDKNHRKAALTTWEEPQPQHHIPSNSFTRHSVEHNTTGPHESDMNDAPNGS